MSVLSFTMAAEELYTLRDFLRFTVSAFHAAGLFFGHGSSEAYDEAAYLLLHSLHLPPERLEVFLDARLLKTERAHLVAVLQQRIIERKPAAYITQEAFLGDFKFYVDERVIVPRSFIAELLREQLYPWIDMPDSVESVLDLCTGSGCLAILAAHSFHFAQVDAVDISADALAVAARNVADYALGEQVHLIQSDGWQQLVGRQYDLIISNPPYVNAESVATLPAEYLHEPEIALGSGTDGLDFTHIILANAARHLTEYGVLVVEIGHNRDALEAAYPQIAFTWLEVAAGDSFVFMLNKSDLLEAGLA